MLQVLLPGAVASAAALYLDDVGTAYVYLVSPCGGVVGGDIYSMTVVVEPEARVCLTTPSATKLYATPGTPARQQLDITLHAGGTGVSARTNYSLCPSSVSAANDCAAWPWSMCLGDGDRRARTPGAGKAFAYRDYDSSVCIEDASGQVVLRERTRLRPGWQRLDGPGLFEGYDYLGSP